MYHSELYNQGAAQVLDKKFLRFHAYFPARIETSQNPFKVAPIYSMHILFNQLSKTFLFIEFGQIV